MNLAVVEDGDVELAIAKLMHRVTDGFSEQQIERYRQLALEPVAVISAVTR